MSSWRDVFPPIGTYAFCADGHTSALIAPTGAVEWLCAPRFDSPSVFGAMLDRGAGSFRMGPSKVTVPISRRYLPGTLILETTWYSDTGWLVVEDALTVSGWIPDGSRGDGPVRPRADHEVDGTLVRRATCIDGRVEVSIDCRPVFGYGREPARWSNGERGEALASGPQEERLQLRSDLELTVEEQCLSGRLELREGESCFAAVCWSDEAGGPRSAPEARERLETTAEFWRSWLHHGHFPDHPWRVVLQRSALVLKGLTYAPTGAIVAAATTSLPETPGGERNWDYRFCWIRDATFSLWALHTLGFDQEATAFMDFFTSLCQRDPSLQIMYGIDGERDLTERTLEHLEGYDGARPVRTGNGAFSQRQNDVWGALLDSAYIHAKALGPHEDRVRKLLDRQVETAIEAWSHPDQGIWETRGEPRHYVSSKLMMWVAVDRGARLARMSDDEGLAEGWERTAGEFREELLERGVRDGIFRQHYETDALDASTLLIPLVRFLPPDDERVKATVLAVADELDDGGLILRYNVEETDDGLTGREGSFTICSFWLVSALSEIGERERARELCERLLNLSGSLDLFAEEIEARSGRQLGNFPQAFTHLALINAVSHVIADQKRSEEVGLTAVFSEMRNM